MSMREHLTGLYTLGTCEVGIDKFVKHHATKEERADWLSKSYLNWADAEFDDEDVEKKYAYCKR